MVLFVGQPLIEPAQLCVFSCGRHAGLHQKKSHKTIALLANGSHPPPGPTGVFAGNQAHIAGYFLAPLEALDIPQRQHGGQGQDRPHSGMGHQQPDQRPLLGFLFRRLAQLLDVPVELLQDFQQIIASPLRPHIQIQALEKLHAFLRPQLALLLEAFVHGNVLQLVLHPRPHLHQRVPVLEQLPQVQFSHRRYPDTGKAFFQQQL